jgi:hypothetical protein
LSLKKINVSGVCSASSIRVDAKNDYK